MKKLNSKHLLLSTLTFFALAPLAHAEPQPPANRVSIEDARKAASTRFNGKVQGEELEFEGGKWIYSFDMKSPKDKRVHEIHVDAISGKVIDAHTETAADERKEKAEDAKESVKK